MSSAATGAPRRNRKLAKHFKWTPLFIMMAPGLIYLFINNYIPMAGLVIAFKKMDFRKGIWGSDWAGFDNFKYLFTTPDAFIITRNTILYNVAFIIVNIVVGVIFAIFISEMMNKHMKKLYQSAVLLPFLMSMVIVSYIVYAVLSPETGLMNKTILPLLGKEPISWYSESRYWPFILIFVNTWKGVGYGCLIYMASIIGIDRSLYEAAEIDGAGKWNQIRTITLPMLVPSIITLTLLNVGRIFFSDFSLFYQVPQNSGILFNVTNTIDTYVYRALLQLGDTGMASAAGFYQSVVGFVLILACNWIVRKLDRDSALF
ncbi:MULTISPECIES: ABC transporter permease subunit [unclassified Paenibacillus]|uniref:ABC transporter permease n=1 Tax=unclassified Paenibacillus TaxID=185978 RepID=UPI002404BF35|nr:MULTISPECIES: ABC transporter permease subunit [unclassified Paenibacillus]MDF9843165.1 putative aldouronate transport system permease protein [Paenibacillus sp. PastF-2]MDF9849623.1 putative aldouronate transport system permease protein [Paenibacillus sp. PastM-2]MDF9856460.1 putative aldouronate transport system permease protein [Paenibacillus sp. PastF-1]MDH6481731.1 putative aldouronate transport system permease protein [Paenibacillus sp. PastH-2]MDH6509012.1 putative aldouronate transp